MEQVIVIKHVDGSETMFPNRQLVAMVTRAEQRVGLLGEDVLSVDITSANTIRFNIGDFINVFGRTYTLNQLPSVKKNNSRSFNYTLTFESEQYELMDCAWLLPDDTTGDSFTGTLGDFLGILINTNLARGNSEWILGTYPQESETKTLSFPDSNCLNALQKLCSEFNVEFEIVRDGITRVLNIKTKIGDEFPFPFHYGRTGGLYNIDRKNNNNKNVISRLYAFGSTQNIPSRYRYKRLCLPGKEKNQSFIEDDENVQRFGHRENVHNFDDIKPERVGTVAVVSGSILKFTDSTMFDLNEKTADGSTKWLIPGAAAKIEFTTGNLAGYSFDVNNYVHSTHTFTINSFTDENGAVFPNPDSAAFQFADGDKYIITDIVLPDSYIADAENRLAAKAREYYDEYCKPHVDYSIQVDWMLLKRILNDSESNAGITNIFNAGDQIHVIDDDLGIDEKIRIRQFSRDVLNPYSYTLTLSNDVTVTNLQRVIGDLTNINQVIQMNNLNDGARAKRNWKTTQEVLNAVFDAEGDYYTEKIKPNSIETQMLAVGARPQQYMIKGALIQANYGGDPNAIHVNSGVLEHYTIDPSGAVKTWQLSDTDVSGLDPSATYYIYAKCDKNGDGGQIIFSDVQHSADGDSQYYYFVAGVLSTMMSEGADDPIKNPNASRQVSLTYGSTTINGRFINTGRIQSADGGTYFDMDKGEIGGNIDFQDSVITETILIKNGKNSSGDTLYCGAISGNEDLPVLWVSGQNTTDMDAVKSLSQGACPVKITKDGFGSNIGCLGIIDNNVVEVSGDNGNVRISSNNIITENANIGSISISDKMLSVYNGTTTRNITDKHKDYFDYNGTSMTVITGQNPRTLVCTSPSSGALETTIKFNVSRSNTQTQSSAAVSCEASARLKFDTSADGVNWQTRCYWDTESVRTIITYATGESGSKTSSVTLNMTPILSNAMRLTDSNIYIRASVEFTVLYSNTGTAISSVMATVNSSTNKLPTLHFVTQSIANILAGGGMTSSLDSDNYFKLYPSGGRLAADLAVKGVFKQFSNSYSSSYVVGWKWGPLVMIRFKIEYAYKEVSALTIPSGFRIIESCDTVAYGGHNIYIRTDGVIHPYDLASGETLWGYATYFTNQ